MPNIIIIKIHMFNKKSKREICVRSHVCVYCVYRFKKKSMVDGSGKPAHVKLDKIGCLAFKDIWGALAKKNKLWLKNAAHKQTLKRCHCLWPPIPVFNPKGQNSGMDISSPMQIVCICAALIYLSLWDLQFC